MPYYFYAWLATFSSGFAIITSKITSKHAIKNPWLFNFLWAAITLLFTIPFAVINHAGLPHTWMAIVVAALFVTLFNISYIFTIYKLDVTTLSPLFNFRTIFAVLLGTIFLHESLSTHQLILFIVIFAAGLFATIDEKMTIKSFFKPAIGIGLLTMVFLAFNNMFIKLALADNDLWTANLWMAVLNVAFLLPTLPLFYKDLKTVTLKQAGGVTVMGIFQTIVNFSANIAYGVNIGITSIIMSLPISFVLIVAISFIWPKLLEKHTMKVYAIRFIATIIMIVSAMKLTG